MGSDSEPIQKSDWREGSSSSATNWLLDFLNTRPVQNGEAGVAP